MPRPRQCLLNAGLLLLLAVCAGYGPLQKPAGLRAAQADRDSSARSKGVSETADDAKVDESWQVISIGEQRVGYAHVTIKPLEKNGEKRLLTTTETHMTIKRFGQALRIQIVMQSRETADGRLISFSHVTKNPPAAPTRIEGTVRGEELVLKTTVAGQTRESTTDWDKSIKSPAYQERQLAEKPLKPGESRSFDIFVPELRKTATVTVTAGEKEQVTLFGDKTRKLLRLKTTISLLPTATRSWVDEKGNTLKTETDLLGLVMTTYEVSEEEALKSIVGGELDLAVGSLIKVDPIRNGHDSKKAVYRITTPDADPARYLVADGAQSIERVSADTVKLTVRPPEIPKQSEAKKIAAEYLANTSFLQCTDERVIEHAKKAAGEETNPAEIARRMEKYVWKTLEDKNFSTAMASAAEVAEKLEGDCTEHAVLLSAMLRARRIPSRIAVGLVYIERTHQFGGHMWSEAWLDGKWIPLDATLGRGGIGAAHIKMAQSSFSDDGPAPVLSFLPLMKVLGTMKIEVIEAE